MRRNPNALCHGEREGTYYTVPKGTVVSLAEMHACWMFRGMKPEGYEALRFQVSVDEVWPWRLFRYRGLDQRDDAISYWDEMLASLRKDGWWPRNPLIIMPGRDGCITLEGNHKLQMARELGITHVPARVHFAAAVCSYTPGVHPYHQKWFSHMWPEVMKCEPGTFRRLLETWTSTPPYSRIDVIVHSIVNACKEGGLFGDEFEQPPEFYWSADDKHFAKRSRQHEFDEYRKWVDSQMTMMRNVGITWPLKHVWPAVVMHELRDDQARMRKQMFRKGSTVEDILGYSPPGAPKLFDDWMRQRFAEDEAVGAARRKKEQASRYDDSKERVDEIMALLGWRR